MAEEAKKSNKRFITIVISVLVVLNLMALFVIGAQNYKQKILSRDPQHQELAARALSRQLELTEEQNAELSALRKAHFGEIQAITKGIRESRIKLFEHLREDQIDSAYVDSLSQSIGYFVSQQEMMTFNHMQEVKAILTPEQLKNFDKVAGRMGRLLTPQGKRRPGGKHKDGGKGKRQGPPPPSSN